VAYARDGFSGLEFLPQVEDMRGETVQFIRYHACATKLGTDLPRHYSFGCNFEFYGQHYEGAPLSMVKYALSAEWPYSESILGPVFYMTPEQKAEEESSDRDREDWTRRYNPPKTPEYRIDPCNGHSFPN